jgi:hypothetical protein
VSKSVGSFLNSFFNSLTVRFTKVWNKLRIWTSPHWWRTQGFTAIRTFFAKLFNVKPKDKKDYYTIFKWMVSKRLAFALIVAIGILSIYYILVLSPIAPRGSDAGAASLPIYKYNSIPLRFVRGDVRIRARSGYIAYEGAVERGQVKGPGRLYSSTGTLIYDGEFDKNMYNGSGRLYFPSEELNYEGDFSDNLFHGTGRQYRMSGSLEYDGNFIRGIRHGQGQLYNASGVRIYDGIFQMGRILYSELIGKTTAEIANMYTGAQNVYFLASDYCVEMHEINAVYSVYGGQDNLEADWIVSSIIVLEDTIYMGGQDISEINRLTEYFGTPDYYGEVWIGLSEAVAISLIGNSNIIPAVEMQKTAIFDDVFEVNSYDRNFSLYIFAYKSDGLLYTFYCLTAGAADFFMYSITA